MFLKRIFCVLCSLCVLIGTLALPSYAAATKLQPVNLLLTDQIIYSGNGAPTSVYQTYVDPVYTNYFTWSSVNAGYPLEYISIFLTSDSWIANSTLSVNGGIEITGVLIGSDDGLFEFRYPVDMIVHSMQLKVVLTDPGEYLSINSATGYFSNVQIPGSVYAYGYGEFTNTSSAGNDYTYRSQIVNRTQITFPYSHAWTSTYSGASTTGVSWNGMIYYFDIQTASLSFNFYDTLTVQLITPNSTASAGLAVYAKGGDIVDVIDYTKVSTFEFSPMSDLTVNGVKIVNDDILYFHSYEFDLSGWDLSLYTLDFNIFVSPMPTGRDSSTTNSGYFTYIDLQGMYFTEASEDLPWYQKLWYWISGGFDRLIRAIEGTPDGTDPLEDPGHALETQASEFNEAIDIIESVPRPSIDVEKEFADLPEPDPLVISSVNAMTGDQWLVKILVMAALFALIGIVLYGGKD